MSSIGEGMVDITAVEPDYRVFPIKRAAANLIDHIEQLSVPPGTHGPELKQKAMEFVLAATQYAKEAASLREQPPQVHPPLEYSHEHPEGAPV